MSGSLHFGIKFYCSDEDGSSKLLFFFFLSVPTAVADRRFFVVKGRKMPAVGTFGGTPTNPSIFRAFSAQPKVSDCTGKN